MFRIDIKEQNELTQEQISQLQTMWNRCATRIILSTTMARSGHPGGSLSSLHTLLVLYSVIRHRPAEPRWPDRDRVVVSIGHISPGIYSVLTEFGYFSEEDFLTEFRRAGSPCAGHVEQTMPGVEWNTGNLGQGLSVGTGICLAQNLLDRPGKTIVLMGDGEQQKGQISEARRFATKFRQGNLIGVVDRNHLQIGGSTEDVMPVRVRDEYTAAGWNVLYVPDGHDFHTIFKALRRAWTHDGLVPGCPTVLVTRTVMGKGISLMEDKAKYHGSPLSKEDAQAALRELGQDQGLLELWSSNRIEHQIEGHCKTPEANFPSIDPGEPIVYNAETKTDCRSAYGAALKDLAQRNNVPDSAPKIIGFSCDLEGSVKMQGFHSVSPNTFIETGIQEHHTATCAGAVSREGLATFFSTFGVFAAAETYNQHRLNDLNRTHLKIVSTHLGLDVGEDGPTHQSLDYVGLLNNLFGFSIFMPADPNQTDRIIRFVATNPGNCFVGMGRSKLPIITTKDGKPFFDADYLFQPGQADWLRQGDMATFLTYGSATSKVLKAWSILDSKGLSVGILNMASLKPIDKESILEAAKKGPLITVEDHVVRTGLGAIVAQELMAAGAYQQLLIMGVTHYGSSGKPDDLYCLQGLDAESLAKKMEEFLMLS
ncbi:MAG: transketolase [Deltaproteobacteria bacterium]|nr:transketolase [Deltaproteobacteria bacterium]MDL1960709.1 transketolase [Deltaproteobacteria bacterium]